MRANRPFRLAIAGIAAVIACAVSAARAAVIDVYDNTTTNTGSAAAVGGAIGTGPTNLMADDITPAAGHAGQTVTEFQFGLYNSTASTSA